MGRLTTHVLDTAQGRPAAGCRVELHSLTGDRRLLKTFETNADGRCNGPLLEGEALRPGVYELVFDAGAYYAATGLSLPNPPFLDQVVVRFGIATTDQHYHVPLLLSPWSYTTYRGS
jgi:5-hydroxyisourate hydrolase